MICTLCKYVYVFLKILCFTYLVQFNFESNNLTVLNFHFRYSTVKIAVYLYLGKSNFWIIFIDKA